MRSTLVLALSLLFASCAWFRTPPPEYDKVRSSSGLVTRDLAVPEQGEPVQAGDFVAIHYELWISGGALVESSQQQGAPVRFEVGAGQVPPGIDEGVLGMRRFGRRRIVVPSALGYGDEDRPPGVPADATLVFDVELMEHEPRAKP
jgi:FKBP-type peptidyl-prolyl cis-trans isomerase